MNPLRDDHGVVHEASQMDGRYRVGAKFDTNTIDYSRYSRKDPEILNVLFPIEHTLRNCFTFGFPFCFTSG